MHVLLHFAVSDLEVYIMFLYYGRVSLEFPLLWPVLGSSLQSQHTLLCSWFVTVRCSLEAAAISIFCRSQLGLHACSESRGRTIWESADLLKADYCSVILVMYF